MTTTTPVIPIEDPLFYLNDPWPTFARMRRESPLYYYEPLDTFVVTRHEDVREVTKDPSLFVNSRGLFLNDIKYAPQAGDDMLTDSFFPKGGEQVGTTDPPRHAELRRVLAPAFSSATIRKLKAPLEAEVASILDDVVSGETVDWIPYASLIPIKASSALIGLPDADADAVQFWSDELEKLGGTLTLEELQAAAKEFSSLQAYILEVLADKRRNPGDGDLITTLLQQELDNEQVSEANVVMFAMTMLAAGSDTTRALLAGLIYALARHPEQWDLLREDRSRIPLAVEEGLRWVTPARAFLRTASRDTEVNGQAVRNGQHTYLMYMAANRDEDVFPHADRFDVTRAESVKHLALGAGAHACAGSRLLRLEAPIVLNALLDRFSRVEVAGDPTPVIHLIRNGWSSMPLVFRV